MTKKGYKMYKFNVIKALIGCLMVSVLNADYAGDVYSHAGYKGEKLAINTDISYGEKHLTLYINKFHLLRYVQDIK